MSELDRIGREIVDAAFTVHSTLGPGLLEMEYEVCLDHELRKRGFQTDRQKAQPVVYDGITFDLGYRLDLVVENLVVIELKTVAELLPVHQAQLLTYLKLSGKHLGFLINFNSALIKNGIRRIAHQLPQT